jgi:hypothetical protein
MNVTVSRLDGMIMKNEDQSAFARPSVRGRDDDGGPAA